MRDPFFTTVLPFLADDLAARGGIQIADCNCPPDGPCLGLEDMPEVVVIVQAMNDDDFDDGSGAAEPPYDPFDDNFDDDDDFEDDDVISEEELAAIEREENRQAVDHLGGVIDNMVYIVGMYTSLVQNKVGA
ncbi:MULTISPECIES: hypothetical protein [Bradyrhizobium]|jgi:hypothetical protein|uniref:Uncharacterized protein n=1 Tax=Bradyrhizobium elkanii TaxID=29448 RepID=A0A8I2C932_BRAEL|nr:MULTISPECIES: hypothetical protein [Bradyrhizobium]MBP1297006.1 hypothetical protein [Bradyrhizobium elkanii]MCP1932227.1 hypothetical protein [Bradyrhizobium elkanii]MCS3449963.1 hypothetical protein [Bradyrhizobium elkanii]MCS3558892.1 hypothetical protein [Bradyrhizobium elkanii]MCS3577233.1 hypothetical protein [Bradyrhizobium elkanii]